MSTTNQCKLFTVITLSVLFFLSEAVASYLTQSLVLLADAYRMLYNNVALAMFVISYKILKRASLTNTFGWARLEVLGSLINTIFLMALNFSLLMEFFQTLVHSSHEDSQPLYPQVILGFGLVGFFLNLLCFTLIGGYHHREGCRLSVLGHDAQLDYVVFNSEKQKNESEDEADKPLMNKERRVNGVEWSSSSRKFFIMDATRDYVSSLLVIVCACSVMLGNTNVARFTDPTLCAIAIIVMIGTIIPFLKESSLILLQTIPENINIKMIEERLKKEFPDILGIHDFHIWSLTKSQVICTGHILLDSPAAYKAIAPSMKKFFQKQGIASATIQPEFIQNEGIQIYDCRLTCSVKNKKNCKDLTCCGEMGRSMENQRNRENLRQRIISGGDDVTAALPKDDINSNYHWNDEIKDINPKQLGLAVEAYTLDQVIQCKESSL